MQRNDTRDEKPQSEEQIVSNKVQFEIKFVHMCSYMQSKFGFIDSQFTNRNHYYRVIKFTDSSVGKMHRMKTGLSAIV